MPPEGWSAGRPTILDVAALSGVSKSTVSNVLRDAGRVSEDTRVRVLEAIEALGYRPNSLARDLVRRRSHTIGVVLGDLANTFYAELVKLLEQRISEAAYTTIVCNTDGRSELERARVEMLLERAVSGVVMLQFSGDGVVLDELAAAGVPVVVVSCWEERADCVAVDDHAGMAAAVEHLVALGHERIAHVSSHLLVEDGTRAVRAAGYQDAMRAHGLAPRVLDADAWGAPPTGVTAFAAANDLIAVRLIDALESAGLRVPADVSVVGFDGTALGAHPRIGLTTVAQPRGELIARGLELLSERLAGGAGAPRGVRLQGELLVRESTSPPAPP
jgi:DNA-binding LacI/PurR family transcriptional regulator